MKKLAVTAPYRPKKFGCTVSGGYDINLSNDCFIIARDTKNHTDFTAYNAPQLKPHLLRSAD
jgi:hypothetical protein